MQQLYSAAAGCRVRVPYSLAGMRIRSGGVLFFDPGGGGLNALRNECPGREKRRMNAFRTNFRTRSELVARNAFVCFERVPSDVRNAIKVFRTRYLYRSIWVLLTFIVIANANINSPYTDNPVTLIESTFIFVERCLVQFFL